MLVGWSVCAYINIGTVPDRPSVPRIMKKTDRPTTSYKPSVVRPERHNHAISNADARSCGIQMLGFHRRSKSSSGVFVILARFHSICASIVATRSAYTRRLWYFDQGRLDCDSSDAFRRLCSRKRQETRRWGDEGRISNTVRHR